MTEQLESDPLRLAPLEPSARDRAADEMLAKLGGLADNNFFTTLIRHPRAYKPWVTFGSLLMLRGVLPPRDRELVILRVGHLCGCAYIWHQHDRIARDVGLDDAEIARIRRGPDDEGWAPWDATLLRAADELHVDSRISDPTWEALSQRYDDRELIELTAVVGMYHLTSYFERSAGVQIEVRSTTEPGT